jgi:hypothetical protein
MITKSLSLYLSYNACSPNRNPSYPSHHMAPVGLTCILFREAAVIQINTYLRVKCHLRIPLRGHVNNKYNLPLQLREVERRPVRLVGLKVIELGHLTTV